MRFFWGVGLAALLMASAPAGAATTISSTFETGTEGWTLGFWRAPGIALPVNWDATAKLIGVTTGFGESGFAAPGQYLGNKSDYIGGMLSFDLSTLNNDRSGKRPLVILSYGAGKQIFSNWGPSPTVNLQSFTIGLTAANFYNGADTVVTGPVSTDQFAAAMGDLKQVLIYGDWTSNVDTIRLDNVVLAGTAAGAVPEPASWAMMIAGFGAVGASMRSRRRRPALANA